MNPSPRTALLLIDFQQGLDDPRYGKRNNPHAEQRIADLLAAWRGSRSPVIHVQHMSTAAGSMLGEGMPGNAFKPEAQPIAGEPVFQKSVNSAFIGTDLETHLRANAIDSLVIVGTTTDHCVSSTARMASDLGFDVTVVEDATATHERAGADGSRISADVMHRAALASLQGEFAKVRSTADILSGASPGTAGKNSGEAGAFRASSLNASLTVADIGKSLVWYRDVMGFSVERKFEREGRLMAVSLKAGDAKILIGQDDGAHGLDRAKGVGFSLQFTTAQNVDEIAKRIKEHGGTLESEPADAWGARVFRLKDPDGFKLVISSER